MKLDHIPKTGENLKVLEKNNSKSILALTCVVEIKDGVVTPRLYNIHIHTCRSSNTKAILHYYTTQVDPSPTMVNLRGERKHYCLLITDFHFSTQINFIVSELSFIRMIIYCTIIFLFLNYCTQRKILKLSYRSEIYSGPNLAPFYNATNHFHTKIFQESYETLGWVGLELKSVKFDGF